MHISCIGFRARPCTCEVTHRAGSHTYLLLMCSCMLHVFDAKKLLLDLCMSCTYACVFVDIYLQTYMHTQAWAFMYVCLVCMHVCLWVYTDKHTYMHTQAWADPYNQQRKLREMCARHGIAFVAYSPLGGQYAHAHGGNALMRSPTLGRIAQKHGMRFLFVYVMYVLLVCGNEVHTCCVLISRKMHKYMTYIRAFTHTYRYTYIHTCLHTHCRCQHSPRSTVVGSTIQHGRHSAFLQCRAHTRERVTARHGKFNGKQK